MAPAHPFVRTTRTGRVWIGAADGAYRLDDVNGAPRWVGPLGGWTAPPGPARTVVENGMGEGLVALHRPNPIASISEWGPDGLAWCPERFVDRAVIAADIAPSGDAIVAIESSAIRTRVDGIWCAIRIRDAHRSITALRFRSNGDLWLGTPNGLHLYHQYSMTWSRWHVGRWGPTNRASAILPTRDGALWMGTRAGAVVAQTDGTETRYDEAAGVSLGNVTGLAEDDEGGIWVTSGSSFAGALRLTGERWRHYDADDGLDAPFVHAVRRDREGRMWFLGLGAEIPDGRPGDERVGPGAFAWDGERFERWDVDRGLAGNRVYAFADASDGTRWFGTWSGLSRWRDGEWTHWRREDGLRSKRVTTVAVDANDRVWFGHQIGSRGLAHIDDTDRIVYVADPDDLGRENVYDLATDPRGLLWVASEGGLYVVRNGVPTWVGGDHGWHRGRILTVRATDDELYLGTGAQGVITRELLSRGEAPPARVSIRPVTLLGHAASLRWAVHAHEDAWPQMRQSRVRLDDGPWSAWTDGAETILADVGLGAHRVTVESRDVLGRTATVATSTGFAVPIPLHRRAAFIVPLATVLAGLGGATCVLFVRRRRTARALRLKTSQLTTVTDAMAGFLARGTWEQPSAGLLRSALEQTRSEVGFIGVLSSDGSLHVLADRGIAWDEVDVEQRRDGSVNDLVVIDAPEPLFDRPPPPLLTMPIRSGTDVVGMLGIERPLGAPLSTVEQDWIDTLCRGRRAALRRLSPAPARDRALGRVAGARASSSGCSSASWTIACGTTSPRSSASST